MLNTKRNLRATLLALVLLVTAGVATSLSVGAQTAKADPAPNIYVSLGDSYAAGYQATSPTKGHTTDHGFVYQTIAKARAKGYSLKLANFGCAGATTTSILKSVGCPDQLLGPWSQHYPSQTQAAAAEDYLKAHQGQIALVTVSIGGNDVTKCAASTDIATCLSKALKTVQKNLTTLVTGLREAAGPDTLIVGTTYPDVLLGEYLSKDPNAKQLAKISISAFQSGINPTLQGVYNGADAKFADVTAATGAYVNYSYRVNLAPYGSIPVPVGRVCKLTYFCQFQDIHPRTNGYGIIADLVVAYLPGQQ